MGGGEGKEENAKRSMRGHTGSWRLPLIRCKPQQVSGAVHSHLMGTKTHHLQVINPEVFYKLLIYFY